MQVPLASDLCAEGLFPAQEGMQKVWENITSYTLLCPGMMGYLKLRVTSGVSSQPPNEEPKLGANLCHWRSSTASVRNISYSASIAIVTNCMNLLCYN